MSAVQTPFTLEASATYAKINIEALEWMLARPAPRFPFLDLKINSITLREYTAADGLRSPAHIYGWIQGRGLEALVTHGVWLKTRNPDLSNRLLERARLLYAGLTELVDRDGGGFFLYDHAMTPVWPDATGTEHPQALNSGNRAPADAFVAKGLIAAAQHFDQDRISDWLHLLTDIVASIDEDRFIIAEKQRFDASALARQSPNYSPRMLLLSAANLLHQMDLTDAASFGQRFINEVIDNHYHAESKLLSDQPGGDFCNPGHAVEFAGFALAYCQKAGLRAPVPVLLDIVDGCAKRGFSGPGMAIGVSLGTGHVADPYYPWWPLPETIRSAALAYTMSGEERFLDIWREAHGRFFENYWRSEPPLAIQNRDQNDPIDLPPATPDLDPLYHTGLSLLGAIEALERL